MTALRKEGTDNTPYAYFHGTPTQYEQRRLSTVIAGGSGNTLVLFAHAHSDIIGKGVSANTKSSKFNPIASAHSDSQRHDQTYLLNQPIRSYC